MWKLLKNKKFILFVKLCVVIFSLTYIYIRIFVKENIEEIVSYYNPLILNKNNLGLLILVVLLMFLNWAIEALKWRYMISKIEKITFWKSFKAIFTGVTISIFTPNRIGEYAGRVFFLSKSDRIKAVIITIISSTAQLVITIVFGSICFLPHIQKLIPSETYITWLIYILTILANTIILMLFINTNYFVSALFKLKILKKVKTYIKVLTYYTSQELINVLLISFARYIVFTFQFILLLRFLNVKISFFDAIESIGLIFLSLAAIPTFALTEIGVRGSVSVYFLSKFSDNLIGIVTASFSLWFINLVIPALIGSVFIFSAKIIKQKRNK